MPTVIPVRMHYSAQDLWFNPAKTGAVGGDHVVVSTERGTELGLATGDAFEAPKSEIKGDLKPVLRVATDEDLARADELAQRGDEAMPAFRRLVKKHRLDMKPVGVEFLFGGEKIVFYFAAEDRVDFRELVHDLASEFHQRVDMRQIGVRDEASIVGGYAPCGQELCCVRLGGRFEPVSIRMAKEQDLPLNSAKISGVCGRLMCCLRYEFEAYKDFKQRAPKKNALIDTPLGKAKIVEYNTPRELVTLRLENGKSFTVALKDMTCSEACCKRAAEQHTPLRPDTVTREALEALGTAEIALQLAELDRANNPQAYALDDSLVAGERRTPRKRASREESASPAEEQGRQTRRKRGGSQQPPAGEGAGGRGDRVRQATDSGEPRQQRRRQQKASQQEKPATQQQSRASSSRKNAAKPASAEPASQKTTRRRHTRATEGQRDETARPQASRSAVQHEGAAGGDAPARRQRTHRAPSGEAAQTSAGTTERKRRQHRSAQEGAGDPAAQTGRTGEGARNHRRRPGDRGGSETGKAAE